MAITVQHAHIDAYTRNVIHLAQQRGSRLRRTVMEETGEGATHSFERLGLTAAAPKTVRYPATPNLEVPHSRRQCDLGEYQWGSLIDRGDDVRTIIDITGKYSQNAAMAMGRQWDDIIIAAMMGSATAKTATADPHDGISGLTAVPLPASQLVADTVGADTRMNLGKLLAAKEILLASDVDEDYESMYCVLNAQQLHELLEVTQITSSDYNSVKALVNGEINTYLGLNFIRTERVLDATVAVADDATSAMVYCQSALGLAIGEDIMARIDERPDISYAEQVYMEFIAGAVRLEEEKVVEVQTLKVHA